MGKITTISVRRETRERLERFKAHRREPLDDVIRRLISSAERGGKGVPG